MGEIALQIVLISNKSKLNSTKIKLLIEKLLLNTIVESSLIIAKDSTNLDSTAELTIKIITKA